MNALIYRSFQGPITVESVPDPTPAPNGVVIKVHATGLCRSDWHGWMGHDPDIRLPHVPGHELAGTIQAVGSQIRSFNVGDRVTVPFVCGCGQCISCISGNHQVCDAQSQPGFTHWGSFAEYVSIDYADINLVRLPESIDFMTAATLGCRFITAFRAIIAQGQVSGGQKIAIHGCGGVGLSAAMIAQAIGAEVIAIDINEAALELAKSVGAVHTIKVDASTDVVSEVRELTGGGADVSLDALGSQTTCFNSIACLKKRGKHIQVGLMTGDHQHPSIPMDQVVAQELEIFGSHGMQAYKYPEMLHMIEKGLLRPQQLLSRTLHLKQAATILPTMDQFENVGVQVITQFE